ncbi:unnamed protein product [Soboliphyme baturini]|uniref:WH2 domain-containing protein n=1 Tax=Soboliphyme baturini TaxID=241478 RepID=A0A183J5N1_9BILA|nr:unnamed protein product [Soboliphyme baturini]
MNAPQRSASPSFTRSSGSYGSGTGGNYITQPTGGARGAVAGRNYIGAPAGGGPSFPRGTSNVGNAGGFSGMNSPSSISGSVGNFMGRAIGGIERDVERGVERGLSQGVGNVARRAGGAPLSGSRSGSFSNPRGFTSVGAGPGVGGASGFSNVPSTTGNFVDRAVPRLKSPKPGSVSTKGMLPNTGSQLASMPPTSKGSPKGSKSGTALGRKAAVPTKGLSGASRASAGTSGGAKPAPASLTTEKIKDLIASDISKWT